MTEVSYPTEGRDRVQKLCGLNNDIGVTPT